MFGLNNSNWHANGIDWIGDAIEAIGYHCGFDVGKVKMYVRNYRVAIPSGMESIEYVEHCGHRLPLGVDESDYGFVRYEQHVKPNIFNSNEMLDLGRLIDNLNALREMDPAIPGVLEQIENTQFQINVLIGSKSLAGNVNQWRHEFYNIESECQYIKTSFCEGEIVVKCRRFRVDDEGLPMVINTFKYKECVSWFLISRLILAGYNHPSIKNYETALELWEQTLPKAQNEPKILSIDEIERFKNRWTSIKRDAQAAHEMVGTSGWNKLIP